MSHLGQDVRYALRLLLRSPGFAAVAILTLALGIGANTAIFSVVNAVLLRPLPYKDADRLMTAGLSIPDYLEVKRESRAFDGMSVYASNLYNLSLDAGSEQILGAVVTPEFFPLLGSPILGAGFTPETDRERLAVLSYGLWKQRFGGDPGVLGRTIHLSRIPHTIVGVMPPEFQFPGPEFKVWVTFGSAMAAAPGQAENRSLRIFHAVAHLKPGVAPAQARSEIDAVAKRLEKEYPETNAGAEIRFVPLYERLVGDVRPALLILLGSVGLVLLIACANVANLLLARTATRGNEIAIRTALGAGRARLIRQLLTESVVLSVAGGGCGLLLAAWGVDLLSRLDVRTLPRAEFARIDLRVLLFTLAVSALTGALFGLAPALQASRADLAGGLKQGGRGARGGRLGRRLRGGLVAAEIALSLVVLVGAGLLVRSFTRLLGDDPGFVADHLITMNVDLWRQKEPQRRADLALAAVRRLQELPGVVAAGGGSGQPPVTPQRVTGFEVEGRPDLAADDRNAYFIGVTPGFFHALGSPVIEGRVFDDRDDARAPRTVIVGRNLARRLFPGESAVGRRLKLTNPDQQADWRTIVGVVSDVKYQGLDDPGSTTIYTPFAQTPFLWVYLFVRTVGDPMSAAPAVRSAVASVDPDLEASNITSMEQLVAQSVSRPRFNMRLLSFFALQALLLAAVGIYGVLSCSVAQRRHEIGVRMALGARAGDVIRLVLREGLFFATAGVILGVVGALAATRLMSSLLYGVTATDPATFAAIAALLSGVALLACYIPARRASKVDPIVTLRYE